jgi:hypothetical protein
MAQGFQGLRGVGRLCDGKCAPSKALTTREIGRPNANTCMARLANMRINDLGGLNPIAGSCHAA